VEVVRRGDNLCFFCAIGELIVSIGGILSALWMGFVRS
jgi:hypothetical protein